MRITKGESRLVIVLPGIAVKLPIIRLATGFRILVYDLRTGRLRNELDYTVEIYGSLKRPLFKGIVDNWREFWFYRTTKSPFLQPTYFSLLGILNIQRTAQPRTVQRTGFWHQLYELTDGAVLKDGHHFENPDNFCLSAGTLRILDYGGLRVQEVVREFGLKIHENFDPNYATDDERGSTP